MEYFVDFVEQVTCADTTSGRHGEGAREWPGAPVWTFDTQAERWCVGFVTDDDHGFLGLEKFFRNDVIIRCRANGKVDEEEDYVGFRDSKVSLFYDATFDFETSVHVESAGVDKANNLTAPDTVGFKTIAGGTRNFGNEGKLFLDEFIEKRRFTDVCAPNEGNLWDFRGHREREKGEKREKGEYLAHFHSLITKQEKLHPLL